MFRVKENPDGSVLVFSNDDSHEFICTIGPRNSIKTHPKISEVPARNNKYEKENVPTGQTRLTLSPRRSSRNTKSSRKPKPVWSSECADSGNSNDFETASVSSYCSEGSTYSFASILSVESSKEPDEDCLDQLSFCRMLNLIESKRLLGSEDLRREMQRTFPIRKIACQSIWQDSKKRSQKQTDHIGFSSKLGQNILCGNPKNLAFAPAESLTSKYERFCKSSATSLSPVVWRAPLLRTRENKARYPVTFKKSDRYSHEYTFNRKQKRERAEYLKLGLSRRSYLLKLKCRKCSVRVTRLSQATIVRYCNPPSEKSQDTACPIQEFKTKLIKDETCKFTLPSGDSHIQPIVSLKSGLVASLLRKFGLV